MLARDGGGQGRELLEMASEGIGTPVKGSLVNLTGGGGDFRGAENSPGTFPQSASWVSEFMLDFGFGLDQNENSGIRVNLAPPENHPRTPARRWRFQEGQKGLGVFFYKPRPSHLFQTGGPLLL